MKIKVINSCNKIIKRLAVEPRKWLDPDHFIGTDGNRYRVLCNGQHVLDIEVKDAKPKA